MKKIIERSFFTRSAEELAKNLLGKVFCHKMNDGFVIKGRIMVTEAYPKDDPVCDANRAGKNTKNTQLNLGGSIHIGYSYGYPRVDVVANDEGIGEGVLIRKIDPYDDQISATIDALYINKEDDGADLLESDDFWIEEDNVRIIMNEPKPRVGVKNDTSLLNFSVKSIEWVSKS